MNIDELIKATGRQQQDIANQLGIDSSRIANFKKKRDELGGLGKDPLEKFAAILKVSSRELLKLREQNPAHQPSAHPLYKKKSRQEVRDIPAETGIRDDDFERAGGWIARFLSDQELADCKGQAFLNDDLSSDQKNMIDHLLNRERARRIESRNQRLK